MKTLKNFDMTQEEKELLIKDLCARLPYGVKVKFYLPLNTHFVIETLRDVEFRDEDIFICSTTWNAVKLEFCKPYLRKMSSMTEEEKKELSKRYVWEIINGQIHIRYHSDGFWDEYTECPTEEYLRLFDWLNKKMFDYRGLIPMYLALEAPEGMYNTKN